MKTRDLSNTLYNKFYKVASSAYTRCYNPNYRGYARYGGRGITVEFASRSEFADYLIELPGYEPGKSLDRIDNDGNYERGNLRWATSSEQNSNKCVYGRHKRGIKHLRRRSDRKCWQVLVVREGKQICKTFSDRKFGSEELAKQAAISYIEELRTIGVI